MNKDKRALLRVFGAACAALPAGWALAQMRPGGGGMGGPGGGMGGRGGGRGDFGSKGPQSGPVAPEETHELMEYRLMLLEEDLQVQPAQRAAWLGFVASVRAYAGDLARERARATQPSAAGSGGVQHIEQALDAARNRLTALEDIAVAAKSLYAVLSPEQKKMADSRVGTIVAPRPRVAAAPGVARSAQELPR